MVVDLKEMQIVGMMPGGVQTTLSWKRLTECLRKAGEIDEGETITHVGTDLAGMSIRIDRN